jgi:hypothetical protein
MLVCGPIHFVTFFSVCPSPSRELARECGSQQQVLHETNRLIAGKLGDSESVREKSAPCLLRGLRRAKKVFDVSAAMMS